MRFALRLALAAVLATPLFAASARLGFDRVIPAPHDLGGDQVTVIYALGDSRHLATFLDVFVEQTTQGALHVADASRHKQHFMREQADPDTVKELRRDHPADVYLGFNAFTCTMSDHGGEGSVHDPDGKRVKQRKSWVEAVCHARVDLIDGEAVKRIESFRVKGEGKSSRVDEISDEERTAAVDQAARRAAIAAAENVTPRRVRESIQLDDTAPLFDEGMAMIDAGRLEEAREIWQRGLRVYRDSAGLHFNLAAVAEALGDVPNARRHLTAARRMSPEEPRYRSGFEMFRRRNGSPQP